MNDIKFEVKELERVNRLVAEFANKVRLELQEESGSEDKADDYHAIETALLDYRGKLSVSIRNARLGL